MGGVSTFDSLKLSAVASFPASDILYVDMF